MWWVELGALVDLWITVLVVMVVLFGWLENVVDRLGDYLERLDE